MVHDVLAVLVGLVLLVVAGDLLVRGAVNLALRLGIPSLIVGLTVVAFGTSAPELLVSVKAVLDHAPGIALGNVVGSNIANILLVLGIPAVISVIHAGDAHARRSYLTMLAATLLFVLVAFLGPIRWPHALVLLAGLGLMLWDNYRKAKAHRDAEEEDLEGADPALPMWRIAIYTVLGLIGLPLAADLLVDGAVGIARIYDVSETVIGLTLVAVGTSLPELATSITAALRREADVAMGNVIGSNVFNLLGIIGIAGLLGPLPVPASMLDFDLWAMLVATLALAPFVLGRRDITRFWGFTLIAGYVAFLVALTH
ncbi:K+-dependent Na+/Ca+ exchanger [Defluviimonas sp. 20V17]|uniref:Cation:H+ antiporter n=1 Tax=Allgaiera indica TaxID=765699 RepID=A0AAN4UP63_9RHOB|nr:calcium/sodium antiporter [Allgaiera indica]KDB05262.1 K+-dependent Na+/Ca+ exchanger [Defluviimonas sp. 20V17]GHD99020.1 sodium:calcium antiporter [Allgaiera indica]SDW01799.1 cation:H+ antiporter [Allgaiera indica]